MEIIAERVLEFGRWKETLDKMVDIINSDYASSVIIRGNPGSGKKTLMEKAFKITSVEYVVVSPGQFDDDYTALRAIASILKAKVRGTSIADLLTSLRRKAEESKKLVIVLEDFEDLCTQRQTLLYNLMNLIHADPTHSAKEPNITLIGLTCNLEWAENLEKRVRSRLHAKCIDLKLPYRNADEYIEFASQLIDQPIEDKVFREQLEYMYWFTNRSIRVLKRYLINICDADSEDKIVINFDPKGYITDYQLNRNNLLRERLLMLADKQLNILKAAVFYCHKYKSTRFTLGQLYGLDFIKWKMELIDTNLFKDAGVLVKLRLLKPEKREQIMGLEAVMFPAVTSSQFKAVIEGCEELQSLRTDDLWKQLA